LTTDDLLRMQEEGPSRKRVRHTLLWDSDDSNEENVQGASRSDSERENSASGSENLSGSDQEDEEDEDSRHNGEREGDEEDTNLSLKTLYEGNDEDDVPGSSRVKIMPRRIFQEQRKPLTASPIKLSFEALGISPALLHALSKMSIRLPTEIQAACIPPLIQGEYLDRQNCTT
jgi:ATP-dependent RNA helicase DDX49/DBP8